MMVDYSKERLPWESDEAAARRLARPVMHPGAFIGSKMDNVVLMRPAIVKTTPNGARERFTITMLSDIEENPVKEWLVDDMLGEGEFTCLWGMPGSGKSVIVGDLAYHVAAGKAWHGKPVKQGLVIYIAAERADLTRRRFAALRKTYGGTNVGGKRHPLAVIQGRLDLTSGVEDASAIVAAIRGVEAQTGQKCVLVVIDTLARTFGAGEENSTMDMNKYVVACDLIRDEITAHIIVVHHSSRTGEKPRGSIALEGAVDGTFKVTASKKKGRKSHFLTDDKENDSPDFERLAFTMASVELGTNEKTGKVTTAPVLERSDESPPEEPSEPDKAMAAAIKETRNQSMFSMALLAAGEEDDHGLVSVREADLREHARQTLSATGREKSEGSLRSMVNRFLREIRDEGIADKLGDRYFAKPTPAARSFHEPREKDPDDPNSK